MLLSMHVRRVAPGKLRYLPWEDCEKEIGRAAESTKIAVTIDHEFIEGGSAILNVSLTRSWHVACDPFWFGFIMIQMRLFAHTWSSVWNARHVPTEPDETVEIWGWLSWTTSRIPTFPWPWLLGIPASTAVRHLMNHERTRNVSSELL